MDIDELNRRIAAVKKRIEQLKTMKAPAPIIRNENILLEKYLRRKAQLLN